jgi:hypothetical protein
MSQPDLAGREIQLRQWIKGPCAPDMEMPWQCSLHAELLMIERTHAAQAQVEALQRENERLKAPVSDEEWNPRCWEDEEGDECLDRDGFDAIIRERSECSKIAQIYIPKWSLLRASLQELVDDLPEDRCADPNCGGGEYGECGVRARAEAALAATQPAPQEKKIWVMDWNTESGDDGIDGFWLKKPTAAQLKKFIAEHYPDDFEAQTFYYTLKELSLQSVTNQ